MFCVRDFLDLIFSLTCLSMPESLSSIFFILLVKLASGVPVHIPEFFISRIASVCVFFIASISAFRS